MFSKVKWKLNKPLIPLKAALFFYFAAGASIFPFLQILLKQKGITVAQLSFMYMVNPCIQCLGPIISGIIADKLGKSKPVLFGNILLTIASVSSLLFIPLINKPNCEKYNFSVTCHAEILPPKDVKYCDIFEQLKCKSSCEISGMNQSCSEQNDNKCLRASNEVFAISNTEIILNVTHVRFINSSCQIDEFSFQKSLAYWCKNNHTQHCNLTCQSTSISEVKNNNCKGVYYDNSTLVFWICLIFLILVHTTASNGYQIMDVTSMSMVKTYNSHFGRERVWSIIGLLISSTVTGYAVQVTTKEGQLANYNTAIYMYIVFAVIVLICTYYLEVVIEPPGRQMAKKALLIIRNIDVLAFSLALLILGTCWCFTRQFSGLYLDTLGAPSVLLGLIPAVNSLIGLPFLASSKFWLEKLGSSNILVLAFAGHTIYFIGYIYLVDPWWSLILEITGILNYHLLWVAASCHSHSIAPKGLIATVMATAGSLHFCVGKGTGSMIGGLTMSKYSGKTAYKVMAATSGGGGVLYALFLYLRHCCNKKRSKDISEKEMEMKVDVKTDYQEPAKDGVLSNDNTQNFV